MKKQLLIVSFMLGISVAKAQVNLDSSLVLYLPFIGNANDSSGNGNNGSVYGATLTTDKAGNLNSAYYFDGASNYIEVANSPSLNPTEVTMYALIKPQGFYNGPCQSNTVLWKGDNQVTGHYGISFSDNVYDGYNCNNFDSLHETFYPEISTNGTGMLYSSFITSDTWYCIVCTFDGDSTRLYLDGELQYTISTPDPIGINSGSLALGHNVYNSLYPYWFHGVMDEIRVYSRVINNAEINALCGTSIGTAENTLQAGFQLFPNPNFGAFTASFHKTIINGRIELFNSIGENVLNEKISNASRIELNLKNIAQGVYVVKVFDGTEYYFNKVIVE